MQRTSRETQQRHAMIHEGRLAFRRGTALSEPPLSYSVLLVEWWQHGWRLEHEVAQIGRPGGQHSS